MAICSHPGCPAIVTRGACPTHRRPEKPRPSFRQRGYSSDWDKRSARFVRSNPTCALCGGPAKVSDHWPLTRRQLIASSDPDPDAEHHLRPLCLPCHARHTAQHDGAFGRPVTPITERLRTATHQHDGER